MLLRFFCTTVARRLTMASTCSLAIDSAWLCMQGPEAVGIPQASAPGYTGCCCATQLSDVALYCAESSPETGYRERWRSEKLLRPNRTDNWKQSDSDCG